MLLVPNKQNLRASLSSSFSEATIAKILVKSAHLAYSQSQPKSLVKFHPQIIEMRKDPPTYLQFGVSLCFVSGFDIGEFWAEEFERLWHGSHSLSRT